jgi:hypothetical protein
MTHGGPRKGAGRPKGKRDARTLERDRVFTKLKQRIMRKAGKILDAQFTLAAGMSFLYRIDKDSADNRKKPVLVTDPEEISKFLDEHSEGSGEVGGSFYYITTVKPDGFAIDSMLNRAFGKPAQPHGGEDGGPIRVEILTNVTFPEPHE